MRDHLKRTHIAVCSICMILITGINACNFPTRAQATEPSAGYIYTAAAETVQAQLTQVSQPPATSELLTDTVVLTGSPSPTLHSATVTQKPDSTTTQETRCNMGEFVSDITIPDDTQIQPGKKFDKTWRLKNTGTCTWSPAYAVVFIGDNELNAPASVQLSISPVAPGETIDVTVPLQAPLSYGKFRQNFKIADETGEQFGVGSNGSKPFWAQIVVGEELSCSEVSDFFPPTLFLDTNSHMSHRSNRLLYLQRNPVSLGNRSLQYEIEDNQSFALLPFLNLF